MRCVLRRRCAWRSWTPGAHDERDRLAALAADPRPDLPQDQPPEEPPHPGHTRYHIHLRL